jgi:AsmA protein
MGIASLQPRLNEEKANMMKGVVKLILGIVIAVIVLMILAAVLLPVIYDKEDLENSIAARVREQTGRELKIDGGLDFSVFPWLAVEVSDLSLSNAEGFGDENFARIGQARIGVALMPLFRKQIAVDEITLEGLDLRLAVNEQGKNNWDDLSEQKSGSPPPGQDGAGLFSSQRVAGLNIRDANVEYRDLQSGSHYRLGDFSMQTGPLGESRPVPLELTALFEDLAAGTSVGIGMSGTAAIDLETEQYSLEQGAFTIQLAGLEATGTFSASNTAGDPAFSGTLAVADFSPAALMRELQQEVPVTADPDVLQRAVLSTSFSGTSSQLTLADFELELDQSNIIGEMSIHNFEQPKIGFEFAVDAIDLDRYLEPAAEAEEAETAEVAIPNEELKGQNVEGSLRVGTLRLAGLEFSDAEVGIAINDRKLRIHPLTARFYDGSYSGNVTVDSSGATPVLTLDEKIDSITFQRLVSDLVENESLSGMAQGHVRLTGRGASSGEVLNSLTGDLGLTLSEGALEGINIWYEIRRAYALYKGKAAPPAEPSRTVFSRMQVSASVDNGVVQTRELVGELPFLALSGNGTVDLGQSDVDLSLVAVVRNSPELSSDPLGADLMGKRIPFKVSGPLDDPGFSVDWEELLKGEVGDMLLDRLGRKPDSDDGTSADNEQQETMDIDKVEDIAKGALFDLLRGKDKDKDKDDDS